MTRARQRVAYLRRVFSAYLGRGHSHLTFWHDVPELNARAPIDELGEYYMTFTKKADYPGHHDDAGVPMLDYRGEVGLQYNPIAISQWGLANLNLMAGADGDLRKDRFRRAADWLVHNLETNEQGVDVWNHHFDWEYRDTLKAPWYSALSQGQGVSVLVRAHQVTHDESYLLAADRAMHSFSLSLDDGGVQWLGDDGCVWFEEAVVLPPTHILNGFIWALWGIRDHHLATGDETSGNLFEAGVETLRRHLGSYDIGFWSLYEHSGTRLKMIASRFYHRLHIVQLEVMHRLTGELIFKEHAARWASYESSRVKRGRALAHKVIFKLFNY